jgi:hypothetical protein
MCDLYEDKKKGHTFVFALKFLDKVVDETVVEIFSTKMGITSSGLYFEKRRVSAFISLLNLGRNLPETAI